MLGNKNTNKKTVMGGVGIALLLCALMVGMTMTNLVQNDAPQVEAELAVANDDSDDFFALPDVYEPAQYEYDETSELEGMRSMNQKAFRLDDGSTTLITASAPLHYMSDIGSWEEIDLNIKATVEGWEVTESIYEVSFAAEVEDGVSVMVHPNVDPIVTGLNPMVVTLDESGTMAMPHMTSPSEDGVSVGGNVIRYPIAEGFDIDYTVGETEMKQNLVIRDRPVLDESVAYFGLSEQMRLPVGYGLFLGDDIIREEITQTQDELTIRNLETGELLATIPVPVVIEMDAEEPYHATYFVQVFGNDVVLTTAVGTDWLMDEERQFPLAIDPSISVSRGGGGYCYVYYAYCYNSAYGDLRRTSTRIYYLPWNTYTFTSANALPTGASVDKIEWKQYVRYGYTYSSNAITASVMETCGTSARYSWTIASATCSNTLLSSLSSGYGGTTQRRMISSAWNSASAGTYSTGTGWKTAELCSSSGTACSSTSGSHNYIVNALSNGGTIGMSARYNTATTIYYYTYSSGSTNSYIQITYSGGSDTTAPIDGFVPYTGITSYKEGERTFFTNLKDNSGIDTTSTGAPHLHYSINNGSYTAVKATTIDQCGSGSTDCNFRATTSSISTGDYVKYYWAYQDGAATPNMATSPAGGSGSPSTASAPSSPYWFFVDDAANAGSDMKMTVSMTDVRAYTTTSTANTFDRQMTYYEDSDEYVFEFDTSDCGTGSASCFYTSSYYFYAMWTMRWTTTPSAGYNGFGGTLQGSMDMHEDDGGFLSISADDGPGMNLIYLYDTSKKAWAMVGLGTDTGIEDPLTSGTTANQRSTYGYTRAFLVDIPGDITGTMGEFDWNATYSSSRANWMCAGSNGFFYFFRSTSSNPGCSSGYYYAYSTSYRWSGFALGTGYYGPMASSGGVVYKVAKVAPEPDTVAPIVDHSPMRDSHSRDRTFTFTITDGGEPPSGINTSTSAGVGPTFYYRITDADGTVNNWQSTNLNPSSSRTACVMAACDWSAELQDLERGSQVEYYVTVTDISTAATGTNTNTTTTNSFEVGDPNKMFIVEWHDLGYTSSYQCTFQVVMYDVTNEIEFQYDSNCQATYDYATVGYQDQTRSKGATLRTSSGYINGANPHSNNYRIGTDSSGHSWETFDLGVSELPTYDTAISGSSNGYPYGYYCVSSYYWNIYKSGCNANIDMPDDFTFEYFGTEYNGSDSKNRVHIGRMGNMYLKDDGSTSLERSITSWYSNMPALPYASSSYSKPGNIAPWWGYYSSYYCYDNSNVDCSVRYRTVPFEGKGTDVSADITQPTTWNLIDSPIRVNPSSASGYLSIGSDLTIEPGVVVQVASGKGLSFDGSCSSFTATGNETAPVLFEGQQGATWKGLAFTAACSTGTDDRHQMSYVDFANTSDAAIAAGSRHGASPSSNANVGNFTMDHVTFTNVASAFKHGSGQGTVVSMSDFEINSASDACFDLAEDSVVTLRDGEMTDCNSNGNSWGGAVINYPGSTAGSLIMENIDIEDSLVNLIDVDFANVWISNVTATSASANSGNALAAEGDGTGSSIYVYNMDAPDYSSVTIYSLDSISLEDVDLGSASVSISPGGTSSTAAGPSGSSAMIDTLTSGSVTMTRTAPTLDNLDIGALTIMGNSPGSDPIMGENWDTDGISVSGCGYKVHGTTVTTDYVAGSCSNSASPNMITLGDVDATYTGTMNAVYARNSVITLGEGSVSMPSSYDKMSKASTNGKIILIDIDQDGTDCLSASDCDVSSSSSGVIYFGGLATVSVYKLLPDGTFDYKADHTVQATTVDAGSALLTVGSHKTDTNGQANVWVLSGNDAGDTYDDHNLVAFGPSGQNETMVTDPWYPGSFGVGDSIELRLEPAPVTLNGTNMDCAYLMTNTEAMLGYDGTVASGGTNTFTWEGKVTMTGDLNIDDCNIVMRNVFKVSSDATNSPKLTISNGGSLTLEHIATSTGTLKASSSVYPLDLDIDGGSLTLDGGKIYDVAGGINLDSGTMTVGNSAIIYGNTNAAANEATLYVNGGTLDWDDSTIQNAGQTGIGLMVEGSGAAVDNIVVKNAAVGLYSYNAAPTINGFTLTDNDVGVDVYGGMSLPTIYRSTLLSGESRGWTTHAIDLSTFIGSDDYMQIGYNSVYGGGNAHPTYNYATSKYYMITDRINVELTDVAGNSWNITSSAMDGYYDGSSGGAGGVPSHNCQQYGYSYNPGFYNYQYREPAGWDWEETENSISYYYPMHYWGYYSPSWQWGSNAPPEGLSGYYNVCLDYAYSYYNSPGNSQRLTMPVIDISSPDIVGVKMYIDVFHNRADNYQDRIEIVARTGDDPAALGDYIRESGTPSFTTGTITGADTGVEIGGNYAAVDFDDVTVTSPTTAGLEIVGSVASTVTDLTVSGGTYGVLAGAGASGTVNLANVDISGTSSSGVYYLKDLSGSLSGTISSAGGAGIQFGSATTKDVTWSNMVMSGNAVGIETAGTGALTLVDSTFANTKDFVITGSAVVDFVEGTVDSTTVQVSGNGVFNRMRQLDVNVLADSNPVTGANVVLKNGDGEITGSAVTDNNGDAIDMTFVTEKVDLTGLSTLSLAGYEAVTVARVGAYSYTSPTVNSGDFRYAFESLSLSDASGNSHDMDLTNSVDVRVCYSFSSSSFAYVQNCPGLSTSNSNGRTYSSGLKEYGYYGATPLNLANKVIMLDVGYWYVDGNTDTTLNGSTILSTGSYKFYDAMQVWSTFPYGARMYAHNTEWVATAVDNGDAQGIKIGYNGWNDVVPSIEDSTISGLSSIVTTFGYKSTWSSYVWEADFFNIQNNTFTHFRTMENTGSVAYQDMCLNAGGANTTIVNNVLKNCGVGVFLTRTNFYYQHLQAQWGADDAVIEDNVFINSETIDIWFSLNSYSDGVEIRNNEFKGSSSPSYGIYTQDRTTTDLVIEGNSFSNSQEAVYMRGALDWHIKDNTINGIGDSSKAGIYVRDGYGVIEGNTLVDADGGILIDGVQFGYNANVTDNSISQSAGRTAPAAVGIWAEDCGSSAVYTGGNTISVMENALVTDGCDLTDTGSTLSAVGGSGGSVYTVQINANAYNPGTVNANEGDTIRWRANEYFNNSGTTSPHDVTSNDTDAGGTPLWSSGGTLNLGSTFTKTFNTAGTYEYHCSIHPDFMYGKIVVSTGSSGGFTSVGVNVVGSNDDITLDGTSVSGFGTAIEQLGGSMTLSGDAILSGGAYGAYAEDTDVVVNGASLIAGSSGSAMYITGTTTFDATDMDTSGQYGLNSDAVDFRWNGGNSDATTALIADGGAEGSVENVTWADSTTQINAGSYVTVTSVGNTVDASKLVVDSTAVIHEGNLLDLDITHKGGAATDIGLLIQSTDGAQAAYVSPAYRAPFMNADGDMDEWYGNVKNPSDDAMPGVMSSDDAGEDFLATWDANNLYLALTGVDMGSADLQIYIDSSSGGDTTGQSWYVSHSLPFAADYVFWAEDGGDGNSGLKVNGFTGWSDVTSSCNGLSSFIGFSGDTDTEVSIPWQCIGEPSSTVRMIVIVQDESTGAINSVHPDQSVASGAVGQTFTDELTLLMGHGDLAEGDDLRNHLLIYRSYVGSNTPSDAKTYDVSVKVDAPCAEDWGTINNVDMSTNVAESIDIKRACPVITDLVDITVNEDSGTYTLTLTDKADDVQDEENTLTWTVADDTDPSQSPSMLLDSGLSGQTMAITPDNDQFGSYVFHFGVEDSHGLTDSETITFTVVNVNDAPIICNTERADCMPVFADDGAGNLNVLDEGFGSVSKVLGSAANATGSYIIDMASNDMANEQPQVYTWGATIKSEDVTVEPYWVQKKFDTVAELFAEAGAAVTANGGFQEIPMTGDPASISPNGTYTLPTLNDVTLLTYLLAQNGCGSVWYQEYMNSAGEKVTAVRSDDGCDSTIDANAVVYNSLNYTLWWQEAYGIDVDSFDTTWDDIFPNGYTTTGGYDPCPAFSVSVVNNELTITENAANELGGDCTIVLTLNDDGGYCENTYLGRTTDSKAACVSYTYLIDYDIVHPLYGPMTITGCYNVYLGLSSFVPPYLPDGTPTGMTEDICLAYNWIGENTDAENFEVTFSVTPVNDAPEVLEWDRQGGVVISDGNGEVPNFPWKVTLTEDDENVDNLTYDLSAMKHDNDHVDADLTWTIAKADTCDYEDYFSATINGDDIVFDLIKDATTNAPEWEVDYLNNGGIHQKNPLSGEFCPITLYLRDTETAPLSYIPNYDMSTANYQQGEDSVTLYVRVDNVAENVPDYFLDDVIGFDYNQVSNIMPKTMVPTTVTIGHGGDEGPYNYDHMLEVTFYSNGYNSDDPTGEEYVTLGTNYVVPPAYGETIEVMDYVYITSVSNRIWVEVDVLTCVDENCDMSASPADRFFGYSFPFAHACVDSNGEQGEPWSCPGEVGSSSVDEDGNPSAVTLENKRRPMLEDQDWCNNIMSTDENGSDCAQPRTFGKTTLASGQELPTVVRLIGTADVPSFAPTMIAITAAGLFVSALVLQSRRDEEEESLEEMVLEADEQAVSPVIATILMVAITVVLSGVIYVWASSLADTSAKGVPRMTFTVNSEEALGGDNPFHRIVVTGSQVELATQAIEVTIEYIDVSGQLVNEKYNLAETTVYGFYPGNSDSMVTFTDSVGTEGGATKSSFDTGDTIYIRTSDDNGPVSNLYVSVSYVPSSGAGAVLRTWTGL